MLPLSARRRRFALKLGSVVVLLLAVMPQVLYLGHPRQGGAPASQTSTAPVGHEHHEQAAAEHAGHCHVGPKSCAGSAGPVQVASTDALVQIAKDGGVVAAIESTPMPSGFALWQRPEKPPQAT